MHKKISHSILRVSLLQFLLYFITLFSFFTLSKHTFSSYFTLRSLSISINFAHFSLYFLNQLCHFASTSLYFFSYSYSTFFRLFITPVLIILPISWPIFSLLRTSKLIDKNALVVDPSFWRKNWNLHQSSSFFSATYHRDNYHF